MSRLELFTPSKDQLMVESLYKNLEQRIVASPPGICPVDITRAFIEMCHAQTCGKCVPCRVGLHQLKHMITNVLNGDADYRDTGPDRGNFPFHYADRRLCHRL